MEALRKSLTITSKVRTPAKLIPYTEYHMVNNTVAQTRDSPRWSTQQSYVGSPVYRLSKIHEELKIHRYGSSVEKPEVDFIKTQRQDASTRRSLTSSFLRASTV